MRILLPLILYHFVSSNNNVKLSFLSEEFTKVFESGHISHKKMLIHGINVLESWVKESYSNKNFLINYEIFQKLLKPESLINALQTYILINFFIISLLK